MDGANRRKYYIATIIFLFTLAILLSLGILANQSTAVTDYVKTGPASWYGSDFHGQTTSSKAPYDMGQMTAASLDLPLDSYVRVTNLANNRSVILRITDRGPYVGGRIIDVSYAAAYQLGLIGKGVARVKVQQIPAPTIYQKLWLFVSKIIPSK